MARRERVWVGIAGESLSNRTTSRLGTGLFRSPVDRFGAWEDLSPRLGDRPEVRAICVAPDDSETIYVGTQHGVHVTTDGGDRWRLLAAPRPAFGVWSIAVPAPDVILAGYDPNAIMRSADRGRTWTAAVMPTAYPASTAPEVKRIMGLACDPVDDRRVYAAVEVGGVLRSDDGGRSFVASAGTDELDQLDLHAIGVSAAGVVAVGRDGVLLSTDHGHTFAPAVDDSVWLAGPAIDRREITEVVEAVSRAQFAGNLVVRRITDEAGGLRVTLGARRSSRDDYGGAFDREAVGARRNGEGRGQAAACVHAVARVIDACYRRCRELRVATRFARFEDAASFRLRTGDAAAHPCACNLPDGGARGFEVRAALDWLMVEQYGRSLAVASPDVLYVGAGASWLAEHGTIYRSDDGGRSARALALPDGIDSTIFGVGVAASDPRRVAAASKNGQVLLSLDAGDRWRMARLPADAHPVYALAVT